MKKVDVRNNEIIELGRLLELRLGDWWNEIYIY
jgi:hypothetical protein